MNEMECKTLSELISYIILNLPKKYNNNKQFELKKCFNHLKKFKIIQRIKKLWNLCNVNYTMYQFLYPITLDTNFCHYWK